MKRLVTEYDLKFYAYMKGMVNSLGLADKDHWWLINVFKAFPQKMKNVDLIANGNPLLLSTAEMCDLLEHDDFDWGTAIFSLIPSSYSREDIFAHPTPRPLYNVVEAIDSFNEPPRLRHPLAELEIYAVRSGSFIVVCHDDSEYVDRFKAAYPRGYSL
jgi:hypothetical protein